MINDNKQDLRNLALLQAQLKFDLDLIQSE